MKKQLLLAIGITAGLGLAAQAPEVAGVKKADLTLSQTSTNDGTTGSFYASATAASRNGNPTIAAQGTKFSSSRNALTLYVSQSNCLTADPNLNAVMFTHRLSADWTPDANTSNGYIQHTWTPSWGSTWDSTYYADEFVQTDRRFRYPSGAIVNPAGNTTIANAMAVSSGPYTTGAGWQGFYLNHQALSSTSGGSGNTTIQAAGYPNISFPRIDITSYSDSTVWVTGGIYANPNATTAAGQAYSGAILLKGKYTGSTVNWTYDSIKPNFHQDGTGVNETYTQAHITFSPNGQTGYVVFFGATAGQTNPSLRTFLPIVYKTTDGGANWTLQPMFDFTTLPEISNRLIPATDGNLKPWFSQSQGSEVIVDNNGELHIVCAIQSGSSNHDDSLSYAWILTGQSGTTARHYIYDVHTSGSTWGAVLVDSLMTTSSDNTTIFFDSQSSAAIATDARIQLSYTADRTRLFYTWVDSDPTALQGENGLPDLFGKAWDLNTGLWTARKQFTFAQDFYFHYSSNVALVNGTTYRVGVTNSVDRDGSHDVLTTFDHYFFDQCTFDQNEFVVGVEEGQTAFGTISTFPNPAGDQLSMNLGLVNSGDVTITLFNTIGQSVLTEKRSLAAGANTVRIDVSSLPAGVYMLNVSSNGSTLTSKVVVE